MGQAHPAFLEIFSHMVKGLHKKPQLISAFILETEIEIALRNALVPCAKAKMGAVNSLDRRKPNQTEPEDGDHFPARPK